MFLYGESFIPIYFYSQAFVLFLLMCWSMFRFFFEWFFLYLNNMFSVGFYGLVPPFVFQMGINVSGQDSILASGAYDDFLYWKMNKWIYCILNRIVFLT